MIPKPEDEQTTREEYRAMEFRDSGGYDLDYNDEYYEINDDEDEESDDED